MKEIDDLKEPIGRERANVNRRGLLIVLGMPNASQKVTDRAMANAGQKEPTGHEKANADRRVTDRVKGIDHKRGIVLAKNDQLEFACLPSYASWIRTRTGVCRKTNSPKPPNCLMNWTGITTANSISSSCLVDLGDHAIQKADLFAKEPLLQLAENEAALPVVMLHSVTEPLAEMRHEVTTHGATRHVVKPPRKGIALPVIDVLRQNEHAVIVSPELMPTVNVQPLPSSSVWIATETERSPRTKLQKR